MIDRQDEGDETVTPIAFRMKLKPGAVEEYRRRHDTIWPELISVLRDAGICDYSIFLDPESLNLFAVLKLSPNHQRDSLPDHPVMIRWWTYMADLMVTESSDGPSPAADASGLSLMERHSEMGTQRPSGRRPQTADLGAGGGGQKMPNRPKEWPLELMFHMD
jgi:L-rhamnose mutarotase